MKNRTWKKAAACFLSAALTFSTFGAPVLSVHAEEQTESELNTAPDNALGTDGTELSDGTELPDESEIVNDTEFTDGTAKAVQDVQTMIDELPTVENVQGMSLEEQQAVYTQVQDAYDAYEALSDEERVQLTGTEIFDSLFDFFNGMTNALDTASGVSYIDANGNSQTADNVTVMTDSMTTLNTGWYVVNSDVTINTSISISGTVHLILADEHTLNVAKGISVSKNNSFTVYAQSTDANMGKLSVAGNSLDIGIGGAGDVTLCGGNITVSAGSPFGFDKKGVIVGNKVTITGGLVSATAKSGHMPGIDGTNTLITGGMVIAAGNDWAAGISCGTGATVTITGGTVTANGALGAGIGLGYGSGSFGTIKISGGTVTATSGDPNCAGIGGYGDDLSGEIEISGGTVTATSVNKSGISLPFSTGANGNAVIFASSIADQSNKAKWSGVIFEGGMGKIYGGNSFTLATDMTIPVNYQFEISANTTLTIPADKTIENYGTILVKKGATLNSEKRVKNIDNGKIIYEAAAPTPTFTVSQTVSSITVTLTNYQTEYGEAQYQWDNGTWGTNATLTNLKANSSHKVAVKYAGQGEYLPSETATQDNIVTNAAAYTITIPAEATAGGDSQNIAVNTGESFDLGSGGTVNVKVSSGINNGDGKLTLTRQGASNTITSAMYVGSSPFTDTSKNVVAFKNKTDSPVAISFQAPAGTGGIIPAGTYSGTVTFAISYSQ